MEPSHAASSHQKSHQCIKKRYSLGSDKLILSSSPPDFSGIVIHPPPFLGREKEKTPFRGKVEKIIYSNTIVPCKIGEIDLHICDRDPGGRGSETERAMFQGTLFFHNQRREIFQFVI